MLFLAVFIAQIGVFVQTAFPQLPIYQGVNLRLAAGAAIAVAPVFYGDYEIPQRVRGWLVLLITAISLWTFVHYLFIHTANRYILSVALGIALGIFAERMLFPGKRFI